MSLLPDSDLCFVCGRINPQGFQLRFRIEKGVVSAPFVADEFHCSFRNTVHGGVLSTILDETMGWAAAYHLRRFCFAAELKLRFPHPARVGEALTVSGQVVKDRGRVLETQGEVSGPDGIIIARAWGKFMPMSPEATDEVVDALHFTEETISREHFPSSSYG